jgi:hypothetical protein
MPIANEAIYRGEINITGRNGLTSILYHRLAFKPGEHRVEVRHWRTDDGRSEMLTLLKDGVPLVRWIPTHNSITIVMENGKVLHILERTAASGAPDTGFYLPPSISALFLVPNSSVANAWGDVCEKLGPGCSASTLGFQASMSPVALTREGRNATVPGPSGKRFVAECKGDRSGWPESITFVDSPMADGEIAASGKFELVAVKPSERQSVRPEEFAVKDATMNIQRGNEMIGGSYSPGIHDPWKLFESQRAFHKELAAKERNESGDSFVTVGFGLVLLAGAVAFWTWFAKGKTRVPR